MTSALHVENLRKVYSSRRGLSVEALQGISLDVQEGEFVALLGPNGAGKSTFIGILTNLVTKTAGKIQVFGFDLDTQISAVKSCIGVVPQEFNFNIFESVFNTVVFQAGFYGLGVKPARARAEKILRELELWDKRNEPGRNLSGGMKRRLMLARALVNEPRLLILDEPTAGVDIELRRSLWDFLIKLNAAGTTIILTTHYLEEAEQLCRRVAIIDQGVILQDGPIRAMLDQLSQQTFILDLLQPVSEAPDLGPFATRLHDETTLEVDVGNGQTMNQVFAELNGRGVEVHSLRTKSNRLEELFVRLTSKKGR